MTRDQPGWGGMKVALRIAVLATSVMGAACGSEHPPASPTSAFRPEVIGVATDVTSLACGLSRVSLADGRHVDLDMLGSSLEAETVCPDASMASAWRAFGDNASDVAADHLLFYGHDTAGNPWYGWGRAGAECPKGSYAILGGAFEEQDTFHLPKGVLLDKSPGFDRGGWASPAVVPVDGIVCADVHGAVLTLWAPGYVFLARTT